MKRLFQVHRWLGLIACVGVVTWGLSGVLHPVMSRLQPQAANPLPPSQVLTLAGVIPASELLARHGIAQIETLRAIEWNGQIYYQVGLPGRAEKFYFDARRGDALEDGDRRYAEHLARHFLGDRAAPITSVELVREFGGEYPYVNRLLPVYRIGFERPDRMRVYVDTADSRLATLVDDTKAWMNAAFRTLHQWEYLRDYPRARLALLSLLLTAAGVTALLGLTLYGWLWKSSAPGPAATSWRRAHRWIGLAVAVTTLSFTASGALHLWKSYERLRAVHPVPAPRLATAELRAPPPLEAPQVRVAWVRVNDAVHLQLARAIPRAHGGAHAHHATDPAAMPEPWLEYRHARTGAVLDHGHERHVRELAGFYSALPEDRIISIRPITRFEGEYGFIFKRLPVYRVEYDAPGHVRYYVEPSSGALAARVDDADAFEGKTFAYLHKWHITDRGKNLRDSLLALFALGNATVALLGLVLFARRWRSVEAVAKPPR